MYLALSSKPRKSNRTKSKRYRAKLKAKDRGRRGRVYQLNKTSRVARSSASPCRCRAS